MSKDEPLSIEGWTPPLIHDEGFGRSRIATQKDIDDLISMNRALSQFYGVVNRAMTDLKSSQAFVNQYGRSRT